MGAISRGWALTKQSWAVLKNDRSLVIFPILSAVFAMVALVAIWVPTVIIAVWIVGVAAIVTFFVVPVIALEGT